MGFKIFLGSLFFHRCFLLMMSLSVKHSESAKVPAAFLFGDSLLDVGNNDYLLTLVKANFPPNGIDFPYMIPTGRFTNGKNSADFVAEKLGLPSPPPYLSLLYKHRNTFLTGVNFASGGSGVLRDTGLDSGYVISLSKQVDYFEVVHRKLVRELGSKAVKQLLVKSLFVIVTGSNDILTYARSHDLRRKSTRRQFVDLMTLTLKAQVQRLHSYGARKFLFAGVGAIGCAPSQRITNAKEDCNQAVNSLCFTYNGGLKSMLRQLQSEHKDIKYSYIDTYAVLLDIIKNPAHYGFTEIKEACCGTGRLNAELYCVPGTTYCANRGNHVFWDPIHPTEATHRIVADTAFESPPPFTYPMNVRQLIAA